jgi:hypothetical protein
MYRYLLLLFLTPFFFNAQIGGKFAFTGLDRPFSARAASLGTFYITEKESDANQIINNPASLNNTMNKQSSFSNLYQTGGVNNGMLLTAFTLKDSNTFISPSVRYIDYGSMNETTIDGTILGKWKASDYFFSCAYAKLLNHRITIGGQLNYLVSQYGNYNSQGLSADFGFRYTDETKNYVISAVIKNAGKQFTSFNTTNTYPLLTDFQLGFAHKLKHAPIRFSYVIHHIQKFDLSYLNPNQSTKVDPLTGEPIVITKTNFAQKVGMHLLPQVEFLFSKNIHFRFAFDYLRRSQMKLENRPGMAGISFGLSMHFKRFSFEYALSSYSVAGYLNGFTFTTNINKWRKSTLK